MDMVSVETVEKLKEEYNGYIEVLKKQNEALKNELSEKTEKTADENLDPTEKINSIFRNAKITGH